MKLELIAKLFFIVLVIYGCKGSDFYQGTWKSVDDKQNQFDISFSKDSMTIKDDSIIITKLHYTQRSVLIENGSRTYGIRLDDGRMFSIVFPNGREPKKGAIIDQNGKVIYTIGQNDFYEYKEIFGL